MHPQGLHLPYRGSQGGGWGCPQRCAVLCSPPAAPSPSPCGPRPRGLPNTLGTRCAAAPPAALPPRASVSPRRRGRAGGSGERRRGRTGGRGRPCPAPAAAAAAVAAAARSREQSRTELRHRCPLPAAAPGGGRRRPRASPARRRSPCAPSRFPPSPAAEKMRSKGRKESLSDSRDLDGSYDQLTGECRPRGRCSSRSGSPPPRPRPRPRPASSPSRAPAPAAPLHPRSAGAERQPRPGGGTAPRGGWQPRGETTLVLPAGAGAFGSLPASPKPTSRIAARDNGVSRQRPGSGVPREPGPPAAPGALYLLPWVPRGAQQPYPSVGTAIVQRSHIYPTSNAVPSRSILTPSRELPIFPLPARFPPIAPRAPLLPHVLSVDLARSYPLAECQQLGAGAPIFRGCDEAEPLWTPCNGTPGSPRPRDAPTELFQRGFQELRGGVWSGQDPHPISSPTQGRPAGCLHHPLGCGEIFLSCVGTWNPHTTFGFSGNFNTSIWI